MENMVMEVGMDIPKLYTALSEWLSCFVFILAYGREYKKGSVKRRAIALLLGALLLGIIQLLCGMTDGVLWLLGMGAAISVMVGMSMICLEGGKLSTTYLAARIFMRAEWMAALEWQLDRYYAPKEAGASFSFSLVFCLLFYLSFSLVFYLTEVFFYSRGLRIGNLDAQRWDVAAIWIIALFFFAFSNLSYNQIPGPSRGEGMREIFNIRALVDVAGVLMTDFIFVGKVQANRKREADAIQNMLFTRYQQYRLSQENIDLLNRKYHDLKHQIHVIRAEQDGGKRMAYLDEMEAELRFYEAEVKTGNVVLDTILTSKSQLCAKQKIQMNVVADGEALSHLHVMDLAAIFGNALDNAIEHELQVEDEKKRLIHVSVAKREQMICIVIENYFEGELLVNGEDIVTTKADKRYHGYGLKSIQYAVEKYKGYFSAGVEDGWFRVKIMLPG